MFWKLFNRFCLAPAGEADGSGASDGSGGAGDDSGEQTGDDKSDGKGGDSKADGKSKSESVSYEAFKRTQDDLHKAKAKLKKIEDDQKKAEDEKLKTEGKWKEATERAEKERDEANSARQEAENSFKSTLVRSRVSELAIKAGLKDTARDDLDLLDLDDIEVETSERSGGGKHYRVTGADKFVERLKKSRPHWFADTKAPNFNAGGGKSTSSKESGDAVTAKSVWELEKKYGRKDPRFVKAWNEYLKGKAAAKK